MNTMHRTAVFSEARGFTRGCSMPTVACSWASLAQLGPEAAPPPSAPTGAAGGTAGPGITGPTLKLVVGCVVIAGAAAILWGFLEESREAAVETADPPAVVSSSVEVRSPLITSVLPSPDTPPPAPIAEPSRRRVESSRPAAEDAAQERPTIAEEARLLKQARGALGASPSRALELTEQHRSRFAPRLLVQEREMIAIEALARAGQLGQVQQRAQSFRSRYPGSSYRTRLDALERRFGLLYPTELAPAEPGQEQP